MSRAYLLGALHDATEREYTYRLSQKGNEYVDFIARLVRELGFNAWTYREGSSRDVYVVEFSKNVVEGTSIETIEDKRDYTRGYFDADGSVPKKTNTRFYIYFAQKDDADLREVKRYLADLGIGTGTLHQPSEEEAPDYWRFYVSANSYETFVRVVGSWHPRKRRVLREMRRSMPWRESGTT